MASNGVCRKHQIPAANSAPTRRKTKNRLRALQAMTRSMNESVEATGVGMGRGLG
ncbi:MAG: hypothetical protein BWX84_03243 [Verrucomicrobia bacterium ADurb.Bin118]|nr:MAG: hypothetical protein BWX84_03243 [Verrucomicrobia bacterium ADurb.Bin118]